LNNETSDPNLRKSRDINVRNGSFITKKKNGPEGNLIENRE